MNRRLVVLPHGDFTLAHAAPAGFEVVDAARAFAERAGAPETLEALLQTLAQGPATPARMNRLLLLHAALELLKKPSGQSTHRRLRAWGAAFRGLCDERGPFQLRLDDLDLTDGATTERSADVLAVTRQAPLPFETELEGALAACAGSDLVCVWLERDQQLPAAVWFAERLPPGVTLQLEGPFARWHSGALGKLDAFARAQGGETLLMPSHVASLGGLTFGADGLLWNPGSTLGADRRRGPAWGGGCTLAQLLAPEALAQSGCRVAICSFCSLSPEVIDSEGTTASTAALASALTVLRERGVHVVGEWWVGAPTVTAAQHEETARKLESGFPLGALGGLRTFHWAVEREQARFAGRPLRREPVAPDRDLARSHPVHAEGSVTAGELAGLLESLPPRLMRHWALAPGRLAACYSEPASLQPTGVQGDAVVLDPDCALVTLPAALDGRAGPASYAANLRSGAVLGIDARLLPLLQALTEPRPAADAMPAMAPEKRAKLVEALVKKNVLAQVRA